MSVNLERSFKVLKSRLNALGDQSVWPQVEDELKQKKTLIHLMSERVKELENSGALGPLERTKRKDLGELCPDKHCPVCLLRQLREECERQQMSLHDIEALEHMAFGMWEVSKGLKKHKITIDGEELKR